MSVSPENRTGQVSPAASALAGFESLDAAEEKPRGSTDVFVVVSKVSATQGLDQAGLLKIQIPGPQPRVTDGVS